MHQRHGGRVGRTVPALAAHRRWQGIEVGDRAAFHVAGVARRLCWRRVGPRLMSGTVRIPPVDHCLGQCRDTGGKHRARYVSRLAGQHVIRLAVRMHAGADNGLCSRGPQLDDHLAGERVLVLPGRHSFGDVPPVRSWRAGPAGHGRCRRQELIGQLTGLAAVEVHVDEPSARFAQNQADVVVRFEMLQDFLFAQAQRRPALERRPLGARRDRHQAPAPLDVSTGRVKN